MDLSVVPYNKQSNTNNNNIKADNESEDGDIVEPKLSADKTNNHHNLNNNKKLALTSYNSDAVKYRECMRNHAATIGGHANDGCGEFMPSAAEATQLTCAACGCHRNFHRRELAGGHHPHYPLILYNAAAGPATPRWDHHAAAAQHQRRESYERRSSETPEREDVATAVTTAGSGGSGKRFRTKFTQEQKERMLAFAESIGWRIQRHDDMAINQFCADIGVKRNVLKVWMHNNKNSHRRRDPDAPPPPPAHSAPAAPNPQPVGV